MRLTTPRFMAITAGAAVAPHLALAVVAGYAVLRVRKFYRTHAAAPNDDPVLPRGSRRCPSCHGLRAPSRIWARPCQTCDGRGYLTQAAR